MKRMDDANRARSEEAGVCRNDRKAWDVLNDAWDDLGEPDPAEEIDGVRFVPLRLHELAEAVHRGGERLRDGSRNGHRAVVRHSDRVGERADVGDVHTGAV